MAAIDWVIIGIYIAFVTAVGFIFVKRAGGSVAEYFVAGRNLPWWLAGTSLIATSFAADTPLAITGFVAKHGIAGNWLWWNQVIIWMLATVFFARLWRRSGILTDAELIELRYDGPPAAFLRGFKAFYSSVILSTITLAWVMLAMQKIVSATIAPPEWIGVWQAQLTGWLGWEPDAVDLWKIMVLAVLVVIATFYTVLSGFWGIVVTDLVQLIIAMVASIMFAVFAVNAVGGMGALHTRLAEQYGSDAARDLLAFFPSADSDFMPLMTFAVYLGVLWWGDIGGFAAQRMFSTRSDRDSVLMTIWYSVVHFAIRPWPWIVVALVTLVYYPTLEDREAGYPMLMMEILPDGVRGLMVASLLAAFMSTVDTHLNWNASYFVNDFYKRFWAPDASNQRCVVVSRLATLGFAVLAIVVAYFLQSIEYAWVFLFNLQAGIGLVLMLRWFWWRVNVWSEISAMIASLVIAPGTRWFRAAYDTGWSDAMCILITVGTVSLVWLLVTFLTAPTPATKLDAFYRKVRPDGGFWGPVLRRCADLTPARFHTAHLLVLVFGIGGLYAGIFGVGCVVLGNPLSGLALLACSLAAAGAAWSVGSRSQFKMMG